MRSERGSSKDQAAASIRPVVDLRNDQILREQILRLTSDLITAAHISSGSATYGSVLTADGYGGAVWMENPLVITTGALVFSDSALSGMIVLI